MRIDRWETRLPHEDSFDGRMIDPVCRHSFPPYAFIDFRSYNNEVAIMEAAVCGYTAIESTCGAGASVQVRPNTSLKLDQHLRGSLCA